MPEQKEPHWKLNAAAIAVLVTTSLTLAGSVWGKADKTEVSDLKERVWAKAEKSEVDKIDKIQTQQVERAEWILQDIKKANEKLDRLLDIMLAERRRTGDASATGQGNPVGRPGEGEKSSKSSPQPTANGGNPVGPNPLSDN